jgi:hypothetical protein
VTIATQNRCKIEPESINMHIKDPKAQTINNKFPNHWLIAIYGVATTAKIEVPSLGIDHVKKRIVQAPKGEGSAIDPPFACVVENDIENNFNSLTVHSRDQVAKLVHLSMVWAGGRKGSFYGRKTNGVISPKV